MVISLQISAVSGESVAKLFRDHSALIRESTEDLCSWGGCVEGVAWRGVGGLRGAEEEKPHLRKEDLHNNNNNHNNDDKSTPRAHTHVPDATE